jgi:hypothetical protein
MSWPRDLPVLEGALSHYRREISLTQVPMTTVTCVSDNPVWIVQPLSKLRPCLPSQPGDPSDANLASYSKIRILGFSAGHWAPGRILRPRLQTNFLLTVAIHETFAQLLRLYLRGAS